jgi:hypothetical protein
MECKHRLQGLTPKFGFIAPESFEQVVVQIGEPQEAMRQVSPRAYWCAVLGGYPVDLPQVAIDLIFVRLDRAVVFSGTVEGLFRTATGAWTDRRYCKISAWIRMRQEGG